MFKNYFITFWRSITRNKLASIISLMSLTIGLTCSFLAYLYVNYENSYGSQFLDHERIFKIKPPSFSYKAMAGYSPLSYSELVSLKDLSSVEDVVLTSSRRFNLDTEKGFFQESFYVASSNFFDMFPVEFIAGLSSDALEKPNSVVLPRSLAKKYFGNEDPVNNLVMVEGSLLKVSAVIEDFPKNSNFQNNLIIPIESAAIKDDPMSRYESRYDGYIKSTFSVSIGELERELATSEGFSRKRKPMEGIIFTKARLQSLKEVHLDFPALNVGSEGRGFKLSYRGLSVFVVVVAGVVLSVACLNFINLLTAISGKRSAEIYIRKVYGACRKVLFLQYLMEVILLVFISSLSSVLLVIFVAPWFNGLLGISFDVKVLFNVYVVIWLLILVLIVSFVASIYPARQLIGGFSAGSINRESGAGKRLMIALLIGKFITSATLIITAVFLYLQVEHLKNQDFGYNKENLYVVYLGAFNHEKRPLLKERLQENHGVEGVAFSNTSPGRPEGTFIPDVEARVVGSDNNFLQSLQFAEVGEDFLDVAQVALLEGRGFSVDQSGNEVILSKSAAIALGWRSPSEALSQVVELKIQYRDKKKLTVVGVAGDANFGNGSFNNKTSGYYVDDNPHGYLCLVVRSASTNAEKLSRLVVETAKELGETAAFSVFPVQYMLDVSIKTIKGVMFVVFVLAVVVTVISLLGLYAMATFMVERRRGEVGIRKVIGASKLSIIKLMISDMSWPVVLGALLAIFPAYHAVKYFLSNFPERVELSVLPILLVILSIFALCLVTVLVHAMDAARTDPSKTINCE